MKHHNQRLELRLEVRNRLRAYFAVLQLFAMAHFEEDRRRVSAFEERPDRQFRLLNK